MIQGGIKLLFVAIFALAAYNVAFAISESSVTADVAPANYAANENISITLSSFAANLDSVNISWTVNGQTVLSGVGKKSFSLIAGDAGTEKKVVVRMSFPDGEVEKTIVIRPNMMAMLWQANDAYVPPFYRGKAMPTLESEIKVVAMPEIKAGGVAVNPKNMTYTWRKDYNNEAEGSGYGKNAFLYTGDYLEGLNNIEATATTTDGQYSSSANINLASGAPEIVFYKKDSNLGILWEQTIEDGYFVQNGETLAAIPYFISPKDFRQPELAFNWSINDTSVGIENYSKNLMPLRVPEGISGTSRLRLEISNMYRIFDTSSREINLQF